MRDRIAVHIVIMTIGLSLAFLLVMLATGCTVHLPRGLFGDDGYSAAEVDAINARIVCRNAARNMVELQRCDAR